MYFKRLAMMVGVMGIAVVGLNCWNGKNSSNGAGGTTTQAAGGCGRNFQEERVTNIKGETIEESMGHFAEFDDLSMAETSMDGASITTSPVGQVYVVTSLSRVRRVLEEGRRERDVVIPGLRGLIDRSTEQWPAAFEDRVRRMVEAREAKVMFSMSSPDAYDRVRVSTMAATYLLTELKDVDSLKRLTLMHRKLDLDTGRGPVAPTLTLYAIHRLIEAYPKERLSERSRELYEAYWKEAGEAFGKPSIMKAAGWNATVDDTNPVNWMLSDEGQFLEGQPTIDMEIFPVKFTDGKMISEYYSGEASERAKGLFRMAEAFVNSI